MDSMNCPNCFTATPRTPCASCGWQAPQDNSPPALALGRVLDNRYRLGRVLGHGGFGITYLAWDENLHLRLAIKEYLPRDAASRAPDGISVAVYSGPAREQFRYGLDRFLDEARTLARFDQHPGIVTVKNFFRAHGTGYCVMDYVDGITLRDYLEQQPGGRISFDAALKLLMPVMDALRAVHKEGLLHRDIAPDNIYLTQDGRIKLLDFGAARFAAGAHSRSLSVILKPGYAPEEQYRTKGQQGPWTDVYGLAATLYRAITGHTPPEALDRLDHEELQAPTQLGIAMDAASEAVLLKALAIKARERYPSMAELQQAWRPGMHPSPQPSSSPPLQDLQGRKATEPESAAQALTPSRRGSTRRNLALGGGLALLVAAGFGLWQIDHSLQTTPTIATSTPSLAPQATSSPPPQATPTVAAPDPQGSTPRPLASGETAETLTEGERAFDQGDYARAQSIFRPLAEAGDAVAQFYLGKMYAEGRGITKDETSGASWYQKAAEQGNARAQHNLALMYDDGRGVAKDATEAVRWYRMAADQGDADAQTDLGWSYYDGEGVAKDEAEAVRWFRKAAEQGDARAQSILGQVYKDGKGVTKDAAEAVRWFRKAAEQGDAGAQFILGIMYDNGKGVTKDAAEAVRWYRKAAEQGDADFQIRVAERYQSGRGVAKDEAEAVRWYRKAAEQGNAHAQDELGVMYQKGQGVTKDAAEAVRWYRKAAEQGHVYAQFNLGVLYENGEGIAKNKKEAVIWYRKAAEQGHDEAKTALKRLGK